MVDKDLENGSRIEKKLDKDLDRNRPTDLDLCPDIH